jgi:hypothetical protein
MVVEYVGCETDGSVDRVLEEDVFVIRGYKMLAEVLATGSEYPLATE